MSNEDRYQNMIVSIVGKQLSNDGQTLTLETGDNATAKITIDPSYEADPSTFIEVMGCVTEKGVVQHFVTRPLGDAFDMGAYNEVIELMVSKQSARGGSARGDIGRFSDDIYSNMSRLL